MGEHKLRKQPINICIYCGGKDGLTDEHVLPFGLVGDAYVLRKSSCKDCARITGGFEQSLLRKAWLPMRLRAGSPTRNPENEPRDIPVKIVPPSGEKIDARLATEHQNTFLYLNFDSPSILVGKYTKGEPVARSASMKTVGPNPQFVMQNGVRRDLLPLEKIEIPINISASDVIRFLAKVAHGYAWYRHGGESCIEYFLPAVILGSTAGALTYIGNANLQTIDRLPGSTSHAILDQSSNGFLKVLIQLFRDAGDPPPIYEVVVGRLR
jgi:hypothetical protein